MRTVESLTLILIDGVVGFALFILRIMDQEARIE